MQDNDVTRQLVSGLRGEYGHVGSIARREIGANNENSFVQEVSRSRRNPQSGRARIAFSVREPHHRGKNLKDPFNQELSFVSTGF
jgi:hypothetical protein